MSRITELNDEYERIMHSLDGTERDRELSSLMTMMEREFHIPLLQSPEWEKEHKALIALYRKLSMSRS